ncbi:MAG: DUF4398 domain-containing protein [Bdellovibrionota bacterium]|nr:DUF4398 domain-containing protein [Bdellovibrionota bacterium]
MKSLLFVLFIFIATACETIPPPLESYTLARTAIVYATKVKAARYSPGNWHKAENYFRQAERMFRNKEYEKADKLFKLARDHAEKAENIARLKIQAETGGY